MAEKKRTSRNRQVQKTDDPLQAFIVSGQGTDEEVADRCAKDVPGWDDKSDRVKADMVRLMRLFSQLPVAPSLEVTADADGSSKIGPEQGACVTLSVLRTVETFATNSQDFTNERLEEIWRYLEKSKGRTPTTQEMMSALAFVRDAGAADTVQSALAVQMFATHSAAMRALGRMEKAEYVEQVKMFGTLGTKLLNAYTRQAEALAKLQRGGEQVIKHVHIDNRGGQAVVTDQLITGGQNGKSEHQPHRLGAPVPALPGEDPQGKRVPVACDQGQEAVQAAWGTVAGRA
jgi:DNA-binding MarR family transcriptional regulator